MAYTLRQVQTLLTKPELEIFQASRADAIKALTERQLNGKISRTRALRDKYRDVYRRQTVKTRTDAAVARRPMGEENNRTEVKALVMSEVLDRFEAQLEKLQQREAKLAKSAAVKTSSKATTKRAAAAPAKQAAGKVATPRKTAVKTTTARKVPAKKSPAKT